MVWGLEPARGLQRLRGLDGHVAKVCFSRDGRLLAALAHNWEVAIWDLPSGFLRHVLTAPQGLVADNSALAFSPDGSRFAFSAGHEACAWDVATGAEISRWKLNEGFVNVLAYPGPDKLLSFRMETQDGKRGPFSNAPPAENPRVCRLRQLPEGAAPKLIKEIPDFNWHAYCAAGDCRGRYFAVDGLGGPRGRQRMVKVFDPAGKEIASIPTARPGGNQWGWLSFDPTGSLLVAAVSRESRAALLEMPSARLAGQLDPAPYCVGPGGKYWTYRGQPASREAPEGSEQGISLFRGPGTEPVVVLDLDAGGHSVQSEFDASSALVAWGRADGTVVVCRIAEVQRRLAELGLDW